jgi:hypothetical protein
MAPTFAVLLFALLATTTGTCVAGTGTSPFLFAPGFSPTTLDVPGPRDRVDWVTMSRPFPSIVFATGPVCSVRGQFFPCRLFRTTVPRAGFVQINVIFTSTRFRFGLVLPHSNGAFGGGSPLFSGTRVDAAGDFEFAVVLMGADGKPPAGNTSETFELTASVQ